MNILAIADQESRSLWDYYEPSKLEGVDLILSCGDLSPKYLLFLGTFSPAPILYVHGNHDDCYAAEPPVNCICVEDRLYVHKGVRILGLGGSMRYKPGTNQYTQRQMDWRIRHPADPFPCLPARGWTRPAAHRLPGIQRPARAVQPPLFCAWPHPHDLWAQLPAALLLPGYPDHQCV